MAETGRERSHFEHNIILPFCYENDILTIDPRSGILESSDAKIFLRYSLVQGENGIIIHLSHSPPTDDHVFIKMGLKFVFLTANGGDNGFSFDFKQKRALTNELEHVEIPFSKTPFDKNRLHEEYEDGHLIIQCTGYYILSNMSEYLEMMMENKAAKISGVLPEILQSGLYSDLTLVVAASGKKFPVHKIVLATFSPVFANLLKTDKMVKRENLLIVREINNITLELLLKFIYGEICFSDYLSHPYELYNASIKFGFVDLRNILDEILSLHMEQVSPEQVEMLHELAKKNDLEELQKESSSIMIKQTQEKMLSIIENPEKLLQVKKAIDGLLDKENMTEDCSMRFDDIQGYFYSCSTNKDNYYVFGRLQKYTLFFEKNYLLVSSKKKGFLTGKNTTTRLDISKCINYDPEPLNNFKKGYLVIIFLEDTGKDYILLCDVNNFYFYKHLMDRVGPKQTLQHSNETQLYGIVRKKVKICLILDV